MSGPSMNTVTAHVNIREATPRVTRRGSRAAKRS